MSVECLVNAVEKIKQSYMACRGLQWPFAVFHMVKGSELDVNVHVKNFRNGRLARPRAFWKLSCKIFLFPMHAQFSSPPLHDNNIWQSPVSTHKGARRPFLPYEKRHQTEALTGLLSRKKKVTAFVLLGPPPQHTCPEARLSSDIGLHDGSVNKRLKELRMC